MNIVKITPYPHQIAKSDEAYEILKHLGYVYIFGEPRVGKTLTALLVAEKSKKIDSVLILTKKAAISGWELFLDNYPLAHKYKVINYEQAGRVVNNKVQLKLNPKDYQLVIIDESHNIGGTGKPSQRFKVLRILCNDMPHINLSGTPITETANSIYYQMSISKYRPFKFKSFYDFFRYYGVPSPIKINKRYVESYKKFKPELLEEISKFSVIMSQTDAGISKNHQAVDKLHYVELDKSTKEIYNKILKDRYIKIGDYEIICDSIMKLRTTLHMLESGVAKVDDTYIEVGNLEKISYIKKTFGDSESLGIMSHFVAERLLLAKHFKKAKIYSSNRHAEGVDLSHLKHFVILSGDYSGAKFIQRRDRITNLKSSNTNTVHHILSKGAVSEQVYKAVSSKRDFNNSCFTAESLQM